MRRLLSSLCVSFVLLASAVPTARSYTYQYTASSQQLRWGTTTIRIVLSTSLQSPPANIKAGSDVVGAAQRALRRWSDATNINFVTEFQATNAVVSDGLNVITVAPLPTFVTGERPGRARVQFDPATGIISEADLGINPSLPFSTDGTHDTYDLESTFVHEIGHMLGLDHSGVVGASMQPRQVRNFSNGAFTLTQTTVRTLSDDDLAGIRSVYGQRSPRAVGRIEGVVAGYSFPGAHVWAENIFSGRVVGSAITRSGGAYSIEQVPPGDYRVVAEFLDEPVRVNEVKCSGPTIPCGPYTGIGGGPAFRTGETQTTVAANSTSAANPAVVTSAPALNPRVHGLNGIIHAGPMPLLPATTYRYYVGGDGVDTVPPANFVSTTPFVTIDASSYAVENNAAFGLPYPLVSFNIRVADNAKVGEYSLRLQSSSGEVAYLAGALVVDPYTHRPEINPIDAHDFFVRQHYLDFLFREPEQSGFNAWLNVLIRCPNAFNTDRFNPSAVCDRNLVSSSFFRAPEFEFKGRYVYHFYKVGLGRQPLYREIIADMQFVTGSTEAELFARRDQFAVNFAARPEFAQVAALPPANYVNFLMDRYGLQQITTPDPAAPNGTAKVTLTRADLIARLTAGALNRAQVLRAIADSDEVGAAEFRPGFVSMQYFGYLKRDPDQAGFNAWLNYLNAHPDDFYTMVNGFINSSEYRTRFGQP